MAKNFRRMSTAFLLAFTLGMSTVLLAPTATARDFRVGEVVVNCSWGSCSYYVTRSATKKLKNQLKWKDAAGGSAAALCGILALPTVGVGGGICGAVSGIAFGSATVLHEFAKEAVDGHPPRGACLRFVKNHVPGAGGYIRTDNGRFCKN